ncbi:MAG: DUF4124 domain-containing protein [Xanthomonadaceae bacterium]|jgi:hypothetical protein|nr:DUF4124 domain-containing protein [Xanthomonadaceae bacterium]
MPRTALLAPTALALLLAALPLAAEEPVFTWLDAQGVRHYSQTPPPPGIRYEVRGVRNEPVGTAAPPAPAEAAAAAPTPEDLRNCERARLSLAQLDSNQPLTMDRDGDGTAEPLGDEDRAAQRRLAEQAIRAFCPPAAGG